MSHSRMVVDDFKLNRRLCEFGHIFMSKYILAQRWISMKETASRTRQFLDEFGGKREVEMRCHQTRLAKSVICSFFAGFLQEIKDSSVFKRGVCFCPLQ